MSLSPLMRSLVDQLPDEVLIVRRDQSVIYQNVRSQARLPTLLTLADALGQLEQDEIQDACGAPSPRQQVAQCLDGCFSGAEEIPHPLVIQGADGLHYVLRFLFLDPDHIAWVTREANGLEELEAKRHIVARLAAGLAHIINNMLMIIEPCLDALCDVVPESHLSFVKDASDAGQRSGEVIKQLMTVAGQRESGTREQLRFAQLCEQTVEQCRHQVQSLRLDFDSQSNALVLGSPGALASVVSTLLTSASVLSSGSIPISGSVLDLASVLPEGSGLDDPALSLSRSTKEYPVGAGQNPVGPPTGIDDEWSALLRNVQRDGSPHVELLLKNPSLPLSDSIRARVFEPFLRVGGARGTGLELAMSEAIIREHGGQLTCKPLGSHGTAFSLTLPVSTSTTRTTDNSMTTSDNDGIRVLVIDDEPAICRIVTHTLRRNGFEVESVSDPKLVESTVSSSIFHVILLDRSMSGFKGSSLVPILRERAPQSKILYFTGEFVEADEVATVDGVVQKPVNGKELTETLRRVL